MRTARVLMVLVAVVFTISLPSATAAHDINVSGVARVFLDQVAERRYVLSVVDRQAPPLVDVDGVLPYGCKVLPPESVGLRVAFGLVFECQPDLTVSDQIMLPWSLAGVVVLATWSDGTAASAYFRGDGRVVPIRLEDLRADAGPIGRLSRTYFALGVEHILFGIDHLLFVLGLLVLVRGGWALTKTVTAFTIAHSVTLGAAVLGYVPVASAPVEAAIALSIVLLAREIVAGHRGHVHLVHRKPWLVALSFGLLHGLGFAGALGEIGLRGRDIPMALLSFNVGVEVGQLWFVAAVLLVLRLMPSHARIRVPRLRLPLAYALGAMAMFWFLGRLPAVLGAPG